jgi:glucose-1-phosphate thymidylyltransferase
MKFKEFFILSFMGLKVVIPVAGKGTRLRPHTLLIPKALINVGEKKIIDYIMDIVVPLAPEEVIFVIGYLGDIIKEYIESAYPKVNSSFVIQEKPQGLGHAISVASQKINENDSLLILLGDLIFFADVNKATKEIPTGEHTISVMSVHDPHRYGVVVLDKKGKYVEKLVEKPSTPVSNLAISGIYYFSIAKPLLESIKYIISNNIKTKGEYQLTDAMMEMVKKGEKISVFQVEEIYDCGSKEKLIEANNKLLDKFFKHIDIKSPAINIKNSVIIPPVYINPNAYIEMSVIGPYVSVHKGANIRNSVIRESIIEEGAYVDGMIMDKSLIGRDSYVEEAFRELNIGPHSEYKKKSL